MCQLVEFPSVDTTVTHRLSLGFILFFFFIYTYINIFFFFFIYCFVMYICLSCGAHGYTLRHSKESTFATRNLTLSLYFSFSLFRCRRLTGCWKTSEALQKTPWYITLINASHFFLPLYFPSPTSLTQPLYMYKYILYIPIYIISIACTSTRPPREIILVICWWCLKKV